MAWGKRRERLKVGARAPSFKLSGLGGEVRSLEDLLAAGALVLAFYKASCPVCQFTLPYLDRISKGGGLQFLAVSQDDAGTAGRFSSEYGITFATLLDTADSGYAASNAFGISSVPSCFLVEKTGEVSWATEGWEKSEIEALARRAGATPFKPGEYVPEWKAG